MDHELENLVSLARKRGSRYIKKDYSSDEFSEQMAELGVYLLADCDGFHEGKGTLKGLNEVQQRIDHFRRAIFAFKHKTVK